MSEVRPAPVVVPTTLTDEHVAAIIAKYDEDVRENTSDTWDVMASVAGCEDGLYGAFGEVLDTASDLGLGIRDDDGSWNDHAYEVLQNATRAYQRRLADEIGPDRIAAQKIRENRS